MKLIYASDMDRTLIFSKRFMEEYKPKHQYSLVETNGDKEISYMDCEVMQRLYNISKDDRIEFIPVTTRSIEEYNRVNLGIKPKFAIVSNGGTILKDGEILKEWDEYLRSKINTMDLISISMDLNEMKSTIRDTKLIDGKYLFNKVESEKLFDKEVESLINKYSEVTFTRQRSKVYAVPKAFNKAIALRWMQHYLGISTLVASGDSELDLPMLAIADYAIIPKHGNLVKCGFVTDGRLIEPGIDSPLQTFDIIEDILNNHE